MRNKKGQSALLRGKDLKGWIFVSPFVLGFLLVFLPVFIDSVKFSFNRIDISPGAGFSLTFVGWENFNKMLRIDPYYIGHLIGSIQTTMINLAIIIMFSLFVAVVLNEKMKGRGLFRAIFFIPVILATGIILKVDSQNSIMSAYMNIPGVDVGASTAATDSSSISGGMLASLELRRYLMEMFDFNQTFADMTVAAANNIYGIVNSSGVQILIFLAGLQSISPSIYESAKIEGCSAWESFWKITLPMISPLIFTNVIYTIVDSFTNPTNRIMYSITGSLNLGAYGEAAAASWIYFVVVAVLIAVISLFLTRVLFYQSKG